MYAQSHGYLWLGYDPKKKCSLTKPRCACRQEVAYTMMMCSEKSPLRLCSTDHINGSNSAFMHYMSEIFVKVNTGTGILLHA